MNSTTPVKSSASPALVKSKVSKDLNSQLPPPQSPLAPVVYAPGQPSSVQQPVAIASSSFSPTLPRPLTNSGESKANISLTAATPINDVTQPSTPTKAKSEKAPKKERTSSEIDSQGRLQIQNYLHTVSGQLKIPTIQELEHDYAKPCHVHPEAQIRAHAAKFLFMKNFPRHLSRPSNCYHSNSIKDEEFVDIMSFEEQKKIPFLTPRPPSLPLSVEEDIFELDSSITDSWTCEMNKLWTRANKIIYTDRIARLTCEGNVNEVLLKRNLQEHTANKFRELFSSTFWDSKLITWLHRTLLEHLNINFKPVYIDSLQILKHKIPSLIDSFYREPKTENKTKPFLNDPLFNTLSHYKLKKLPRKPVFIIIPNGPQASHQSGRIKYWHSMFSSMGKVVTIPINGKGIDYVSDVLAEIRYAVNEKIRNAKTMFSNRPLVLVGFHYGALIATHCALQNLKSICATICLGFPLKGVNGIRGELDDPLLETTVPTQFIIGENALLTTLDDIEDFRERLTKTETSLVVVGGADDKLVVSNLKKRLECLTQSMVDRCVADEIFAFLSNVLINYSEDIASLDHPKVTIFSSQLNQSFDPFATPKPKKKSTKKRPPPVSFAENGSPVIFGSTGMPLLEGHLTMKPPPKRKRAPPKPKTPQLSLNESPHMILSNSPLISTPTQQTSLSFPNLTGVFSSGMLPSDSPALKQLASKFILASDATKMMAPTMPLTPVPTTKKGTKKMAISNGAGALPPNHLPGSLPVIKEEGQTSKTLPFVQANHNNSAALSALLKLSTDQAPNLKLPTSMNPAPQQNGIAPFSLPPHTLALSQVSTAAVTASPSVLRITPLLTTQSVPSITTSIAPAENSITTTTANTISPASSHKSDAVYPVTETHLIHQSTTRTGRPIIPPKSLDI